MEGREFTQMRHVGMLVLAALAFSVPAEAAQITISDTFDWTASTNSSGVTYQQFTDTALPSWTHNLVFVPPAVSFDSAEVELSFAGTRSSTQEVWLLWNSGSVQLGTLNGTGDNAFNNFLQQTFSVPSTLYPVFSTGAWSLGLRLTETASGSNNLFLDYSRLTVKYQDGVVINGNNGDVDIPAVVPEPASMLLVGTGLAGLVARRYRRRRAA